MTKESLMAAGMTEEQALAQLATAQTAAPAQSAGNPALAGLTVAKGAMSNKQAVDLLAANGVQLGEIPVIMDIVALKPETIAARAAAGKPSAKTVYVIGTADLGASGGSTTNSFESMNMFEAAGQGFNGNNIYRAKMTMTDEVIAANGLAKGSLLTIKAKDGTDMVSCIEVHEKHDPFYVGQQPVGYTNEAGQFIATQRDGKNFYRDTKLTTPQHCSHQLLGTKVSEVTE